jgi:hypothetical protein
MNRCRSKSVSGGAHRLDLVIDVDLDPTLDVDGDVAVDSTVDLAP